MVGVIFCVSVPELGNHCLLQWEEELKRIDMPIGLLEDILDTVSQFVRGSLESSRQG